MMEEDLELISGTDIRVGTEIWKEFEGHGIFKGIITGYDEPFFHVHYPDDDDDEDLTLEEVQELQQAERDRSLAPTETKAVSVENGEDDYEENFEEEEVGVVSAENPQEEDICDENPNSLIPTPEKLPQTAHTAENHSSTAKNHSLPPLFGSMKVPGVEIGQVLRSPSPVAQKASSFKDPRVLLQEMQAQQALQNAREADLRLASSDVKKDEEQNGLRSEEKVLTQSKKNRVLQLPVFESMDPKPPTLPGLLLPGGLNIWNDRTRKKSSSFGPSRSRTGSSKSKALGYRGPALPDNATEGHNGPNNNAKAKGKPRQRLKRYDSGGQEVLTAPTILSLKYPGKLHENTIQVLERVAQYVDHHHIRLIDLFHYADNDANGCLSAGEFRRQLRLRMGLHLTKQEVQEIVQLLDTNGNGEIEMKELELAVRDMRRRLAGAEHESRQTFQQHFFEEIQAKVGRHFDRIVELCRTLDEDGSGLLEASEFERGIKHLGTGLTDAELRQLTRMLDPSHTGLIEIVTILNCAVFS